MAVDPRLRIIEQIDRMEPGVLHVFRDSEHDIGFREAVLFVDGKEVAQVAFKRWVEIPVPAGTHTLQAYNRVFRSEQLELDIRPGERLTFQVANVGGWLFALMMVLQMGVPRIVLKPEINRAEVSEEQHAHRFS